MSGRPSKITPGAARTAAHTMNSHPGNWEAQDLSEDPSAGSLRRAAQAVKGIVLDTLILSGWTGEIAGGLALDVFDDARKKVRPHLQQAKNVTDFATGAASQAWYHAKDAFNRQ